MPCPPANELGGQPVRVDEVRRRVVDLQRVEREIVDRLTDAVESERTECPVGERVRDHSYPALPAIRATVSTADSPAGTASSRKSPMMCPDRRGYLLAHDDLEVVQVLERLGEKRALDRVVVGDGDDLQIRAAPARNPSSRAPSPAHRYGWCGCAGRPCSRSPSLVWTPGALDIPCPRVRMRATPVPRPHRIHRLEAMTSGLPNDGRSAYLAREHRSLDERHVGAVEDVLSADLLEAVGRLPQPSGERFHHPQRKLRVLTQ